MKGPPTRLASNLVKGFYKPRRKYSLGTLPKGMWYPEKPIKKKNREADFDHGHSGLI